MPQYKANRNSLVVIEFYSKNMKQMSVVIKFTLIGSLARVRYWQLHKSLMRVAMPEKLTMAEAIRGKYMVTKTESN